MVLERAIKQDLSTEFITIFPVVTQLACLDCVREQAGRSCASNQIQSIELNTRF